MITAVKEILRQADTLSTDEQLALASILIERARKKAAPQPGTRKWLDVMGASPYPMVGEDAQGWVTRTRQEGEERDQQWSHEK